jgi:hypothetical protein
MRYCALRENEQLMTKMRLRRLMEEMLDSDLLQVDVEEAAEEPGAGRHEPVKRVTVVARYIPS